MIGIYLGVSVKYNQYDIRFWTVFKKNLTVFEAVLLIKKVIMSANTEVIKYLDTNFNKQVKLNNINLLKKYETLI